VAKWHPPLDAVGPNEVIGRRLFESSAASSLRPLSTQHFMDSRVDEDLSVDRLGDTGVNKVVCRSLTSEADAEAAKRSKSFHGWASIRCKDLKKANVKPVPITLAEHGTDNPYHAEIDRSLVRDATMQHYFAAHLLYEFIKGTHVPPLREGFDLPA